MKKYDSYKNSGIEWIGEIPRHWEFLNLKYILRENVKDGPHETPTWFEDGIPFLSIDGIVNGEISFEKCRYIDEEQYEKFSKKLVIEPNDIFIGKAASIGKIARVKTNRKFTVWSPIAVVKVKSDYNPIFVEYYFKSDIIQHQIEMFSTSNTQKNIAMGDIPKMKFISPPIEEQTTIANYLDQKTSQIDDLIAKKERLIQLLEEERTAIINQAVTKGLDPSVPMKDSGIEWLGEIPAHWEVKRMRYLCDITTGGKDTENREDDGQYPFYVRSQSVERISTYSFDGEAILTAGDGVGVCKVWHYVNEKFDFHQRVYMMSNFKSVIGKYLFYYLKENFGKEVMKLSAKSTVDSLRRPMFQNFLVCFGTIEEQNKIILTIEKEEYRIQTIIEKTQQEIDLLKEYKTALISEVVTGKVDVRDEKVN